MDTKSKEDSNGMEDKNTPAWQKPKDVTKTSKLSSLKASFLSVPPKERLMIVGGISLGAIIATVLIITFFGFKADEPDPAPEVVSNYVAPTTGPAPLTGLEVPLEDAARPITAVMIENSIDARPQSGLQEAGMVFEAIAEGGITRFMALYQAERPGNVGPIRSARPYYVEWAKGFNANYLHSGGSAQALALIPALGVNDLDHGKYGSRIADRVSYRFAPHNVYSNQDKIDSLANELGFTSSEYTGFERKNDEPSSIENPATASSISFDISGANYNTSYTYDPATNSYPRVMAGLKHTDQGSGLQISPKVVVAMIASYSKNGIYSVYGSIGSGEALVFQDGKVSSTTWRKANQSAPFELIDAEGNPFAVNRGQMWVTAIPQGRVSYTP